MIRLIGGGKDVPRVLTPELIDSTQREILMGWENDKDRVRESTKMRADAMRDLSNIFCLRKRTKIRREEREREMSGRNRHDSP